MSASALAYALGALGALALVAAALWLRPRLRAAGQKAQDKLAAQAQRQRDREAARRVLESDELEPLPPPLGWVPEPGEQAYFRERVCRLEPSSGELVRQAWGDMWITNRRVYFSGEVGSLHGRPNEPIPLERVQRVDSTYLDVLEITAIYDPLTNNFDTLHLECPRPLEAAAYLARFAGFDLILE